MKNEWIIWILLVVVIVAVALYFRLYGNQTVSVFVGINSSYVTANTLYPFQKVVLPISVMNTGGSNIVSMLFSVSANGNFSNTYQLTIPPGKIAILHYNFTPSLPGTYKVSVVADPAHVFSISDIASAGNSTTVTIQQPANAAPYTLLPKGNITSYQLSNNNRAGLISSDYLVGTYNLYGFASSGLNNGFIGSILNISQQYVMNVSSASADYGNGGFASSTWIRGYVSPTIVGVAALGKGYKVTNYTIAQRTVTLAAVQNSTTLCSWYDSGWTKIVIYHNSSSSCLRIYNGTIKTLNATLVQPNSTMYGKMALANATQLGNYTSYSGSGTAYSRMFLLGTQIIAPKVSTGNIGSTTCFGVLRSGNKTSYCSTYLVPANGTISGIGLVRTTSYIGRYNVSVFSLVNNSQLLSAANTAGQLISGLGLNGSSASFSNGFSNTCSFGNVLSCSNAQFYNGTLSLKITNDLNSTIKLNSLLCHTAGAGNVTRLSDALAPGNSLNASTKCYTLGSVIEGIPLNLKLNLVLNYTESNSIKMLNGNATVNIFS
ncbi:MAG: hypothetical protein KGH49_00325 [Candidatus Micrarchaeota archaeon]|nr:hypothetical protein [Candidatus Micrarchaeota archaeon]